MSQRNLRLDPAVIELSDDDDELEFFHAQLTPSPGGGTFDIHDPFADLDVEFNAAYDANDREIIDLTAIPDIDIPPSDDPIVTRDDSPVDSISPNWSGDAELISEAACLQMILNILPDIAVDHALDLIREKTTDATRAIAQCQSIVTEILDTGAYPKESDEVSKSLKRKRQPSDKLSEYEKGERDPEIPLYEQDALDLLKDEFPDVPVRHITNVLNSQKTLFKSYQLIEEQLRNYRKVHVAFSKIGKARNKRDAERRLIERGSQLPKELYAAKRKSEFEAAKRNKIQEAKQVEEDNLQKAKMNNEMGECQCCFGDFPLNRMISCNVDHTHFFCMDCPKQYIETEIGMSHCRPVCFATDKCSGTFTRRQLQQVLSDKTFERLEHMQQQQDLEAADLDFLSECPFCDFRMECPPPEVDKEFRCQNTKCGKTSCRLCQKETHIPLSCAEAKKDGQIMLRHVVEEAMSEALIRHCNKCKHPFVKEYGCNKMTCSHCRNLQCYVCSQNVLNYNHFGDVAQGRCPLHENVEDRHEQEVKKAAEEAMAKVKAENPQLSDADLVIKVSDRVKRAEDRRKGQAAAAIDAFPYHMLDGQLVHRNVAVAQPRPPYPPAAYVPPYNNPYAAAPAPAFNNPFPVHPQLFPAQPHNQYWHGVQQPFQPRYGGAVLAMLPGQFPYLGGGPAQQQHYPVPVPVPVPVPIPAAPAPAPAPAPNPIPLALPAPALAPDYAAYLAQREQLRAARAELLREYHARRMLRIQQQAALTQGMGQNQLQQHQAQQQHQLRALEAQRAEHTRRIVESMERRRAMDRRRGRDQ